MERKIISKRIGSILDDIARLNNALYAMDTTDIQRYPDNYEVLSMDAALRAESVACRLRHLIYASTGIKKSEYLASAQAAHGIEISCEDGIFEVSLPSLLPKRRQRQNTEFLLDPVYFAMEQYAKSNILPRFRECVVCFMARPDGWAVKKQRRCWIWYPTCAGIPERFSDFWTKRWSACPGKRGSTAIWPYTAPAAR